MMLADFGEKPCQCGRFEQYRLSLELLNALCYCPLIFESIQQIPDESLCSAGVPGPASDNLTL